MHEAGCIWEQWQHAQCVHAGVWVHAWLPGVTHGPGPCTRPEKHARCVQMSAGGEHTRGQERNGEGGGNTRQAGRDTQGRQRSREKHAKPQKHKAAKPGHSAARSRCAMHPTGGGARRAPGCPRAPPAAHAHCASPPLISQAARAAALRQISPESRAGAVRLRAARREPGWGGGPRAARAAEPRSPQPSARPRTRRPAPGPAQPPPQPPEPQRAGPRGLGLR